MTALNIDTYYQEESLISLGMKKLNHHQLDYSVFELEDQVYFFEDAKEALRLYCITSRKSFYLS